MSVSASGSTEDVRNPSGLHNLPIALQRPADAGASCNGRNGRRGIVLISFIDFLRLESGLGLREGNGLGLHGSKVGLEDLLGVALLLPLEQSHPAMLRMDAADLGLCVISLRWHRCQT